MSANLILFIPVQNLSGGLAVSSHCQLLQIIMLPTNVYRYVETILFIQLAATGFGEQGGHLQADKIQSADT